ncbi:MAG: squalene/phytoene synthase family protein [Gammaproteobacteria bacterium]|jgi:phytoene synthase|nr:squalene/phytoene synthase family protein [Gammaproteobacteria bacterium]
MTVETASSSNLGEQARAVIDRASKSFAAASRLFAPAARRDVVLLYTWCRHCDDLIDGQAFGRGRITTASSETLERLRADSLAALAGQPSSELPYLALADLSRRHSIGATLVDSHINGFGLDVAGWQPETLDDTLKYCYHTAGTVGIMMARIMNVSDTPTLRRASDLGIAFQLTNIARDVVEDALAGRSYLPGEWRTKAGLAIDDLADPTCRERVFPLVARLVDEAEPYYRSAAIGIRALPRRAAWAIATARAVYRDIGRQVVRRGPEGIGQRVFTGKTRKAWRVVTALPDALAARHTHVAISRPGLWTPPEIA